MIKNNIDDFLDYIYLEKKYSSNTLRAYRKDLNEFYNFINKDSINYPKDVKKKNIHEYLYYLSVKNLSSKTVSRKLASIKSFLVFY